MYDRFYSPDEIAAWARALRKHRGLTQKEVAERLHVSQPSISQAESGSTSHTRTAIYIIEHLQGVEVATQPYFHVASRPAQELRGTEAFDALAHHLQVLYLIAEHRRRRETHVFDLVREFPAAPAAADPYIEGAGFRLRLGGVSATAVVTLNDLFGDGLLVLAEVETYPTSELAAAVRRFSGPSQRRRTGGEAARREAVLSLAYQGEECWYQKENMTGCIAYFTFEATSKGREVLRLFPNLMDKLRRAGSRARLQRIASRPQKERTPLRKAVG